MPIVPTSVTVSDDGSSTSIRYDFKNGYGASVIRKPYSYGGSEGLWELAVTHNGAITYDTPITGDVIGWLTQSEVIAHLLKIKEL